MKIIQTTDSELVAKEGNFLGIVIGVSFVLASGGLMYMIGFSSSQWIVLSLLIIFMVLGFLNVLVASSTLVTFNKTNGQILYKKKSLVKEVLNTYAIADVLCVELRNILATKKLGIYNNGKLKQLPVLVLRTTILFRDGSGLFLHQKESFNLKNSSVPL